jgi:hypothetical protein
MSSMQRILLALLLSLACAGCLRSTTTIDLKPDGSGTVLQETGISTQALAMLKSFAASQPGEKDNSADMFTEETARKAADTMGVRFVSGEPFKTADLEGYRARYAFDDITKVRVNMQQGTSGMSSPSGQPPFGFTFDKGATVSTLTVQMPEQAPGTSPLQGLPGAGASDANKAEAAQAMAMMKMMMSGLFIDVALNVEGKIVRTNAPHVEGSRVTLLQIDFDKLLADEAALQKLQAASDLKSLANIPGLKLASEPKLTVAFSR